MPLNIKATRRVSLNGFATGWDDCYITVNTVSARESEDIYDQIEELRETKDSKSLNALIEDFCVKNIIGGKILNTLEDGSQEPYEFTKEETPEVVDALNSAWQLEVISIATGSDRLK